MKSVRLPDLAVAVVVPGGEFLAGRGVGHGDFEGGQVGAADQPLVDLGETVAEQADGDVMLLDVRVLRPGEQPDQPRALGGGHLAQLGRRDQVLGIVEDDAQADLLGRIYLQENALDELVEQREDHVGVAGPRLGLADAVVQS